ncbi:PREDICTED: protein deglycase DJ-1-like [Nicrophorus vespilloides]|uniref:Protein deglycase DJ-1-like n=1 Tax=Nicrophorus vespilloides TaxID=110193 RepID=A0ABM1M725_NICVS|nr:PREDICTED: protein deglycase DJ-1-like [Nicrophorus vespilloides]
MAKRALVLLYPQNEENEIAIPVAILRRGGVEVTIAGPSKEPVVGSRGMLTVPEAALCDAMKKGPYDVVLLAGGRYGWQSLSADKDVGTVLREQEKAGRLIAAICTSPIAMKAHGIMFGRRLTSYPTAESMVREGDKYIYKHDDVVVDGNLITSKGNYTTFHFGLRVLEYITDSATTAEVATEMLVAH